MRTVATTFQSNVMCRIKPIYVMIGALAMVWFMWTTLLPWHERFSCFVIQMVMDSSTIRKSPFGMQMSTTWT